MATAHLCSGPFTRPAVATHRRLKPTHTSTRHTRKPLQRSRHTARRSSRPLLHTVPRAHLASNVEKQHTMPHNTATPTLERRVTRSMGRPLESVHNTTTASKQGKAGPSAPARGTISEPRRKAVDDWRREVVRHTETAQKVSSTSSHAGPHRGLAPPPRLSYQTGDPVLVYTLDNNGGVWCPGTVADLRNFRGPRSTNEDTYVYPVILDNRQPRILQWFDVNKGHIHPRVS